ncbi:MAG: sulfotransferase [Candidatus Binatus sp.]|uniref:sulfotransferase family protein n=1 Tax=Candidatus Binatus sp. TaxID=2811406 RepID=UPI002718A29E|nr:sulfotransferase [Candidatus Binatus sp.]MDO8433804.1 sulfotransferase [Candidatus Binatus sp.]
MPAAILQSSPTRLPRFIGVGPPRTATTWLHEVLKGRVALPQEKKETDFFSKNYDKGFDWYRSFFRDADPRLPLGEFSPTYFISDDARTRIARDIPGCRIICSFRDPVDRAYSHWRLMVRNVWTRLEFADAVMSHRDLRESCRYGHYLAAWRNTLGAENVFVIVYEDLEADSQAFVDRVADLIGIERFVVANSPVAGRRVHVVPVAPRNLRLARNARNLMAWLNDHRYHGLANSFRQSALWHFCAERGEPFKPVDRETDARLRDYFRPEIDRLEQLTGRDFSAWKTAR